MPARRETRDRPFFVSWGSEVVTVQVQAREPAMCVSLSLADCRREMPSDDRPSHRPGWDTANFIESKPRYPARARRKPLGADVSFALFRRKRGRIIAPARLDQRFIPR